MARSSFNEEQTPTLPQNRMRGACVLYYFNISYYIRINILAIDK